MFSSLNATHSKPAHSSPSLILTTREEIIELDFSCLGLLVCRYINLERVVLIFQILLLPFLQSMISQYTGFQFVSASVTPSFPHLQHRTLIWTNCGFRSTKSVKLSMSWLSSHSCSHVFSVIAPEFGIGSYSTHAFVTRRSRLSQRNKLVRSAQDYSHKFLLHHQSSFHLDKLYCSKSLHRGLKQTNSTLPED